MNSFLISFLFCSLSVLAYIPYQNTASCNAQNCQLPNCYCPSTNIPGGLSLADTPQFIFYTFDDSMYVYDFENMQNYNWILNNPSIRDSMGCTVKATWYALETCTYFVQLICNICLNQGRIIILSSISAKSGTSIFTHGPTTHRIQLQPGFSRKTLLCTITKVWVKFPVAQSEVQEHHFSEPMTHISRFFNSLA